VSSGQWAVSDEGAGDTPPLRCFCESAQAIDAERVAGDLVREKSEKSAEQLETKGLRRDCSALGSG
jgi:hypothetical protein